MFSFSRTFLVTPCIHTPVPFYLPSLDRTLHIHISLVRCYFLPEGSIIGCSLIISLARYYHHGSHAGPGVHELSHTDNCLIFLRIAPTVPILSSNLHGSLVNPWAQHVSHDGIFLDRAVALVVVQLQLVLVLVYWLVLSGFRCFLFHLFQNGLRSSDSPSLEHTRSIYHFLMLSGLIFKVHLYEKLYSSHIAITLTPPTGVACRADSA